MNQFRDNHGNAVQARDIGGSVYLATPSPTALDGLDPPEPTFIGRAEQLALLHEHQFVVVSGLAGIGKTALVLFFAQQHDFPGGRLACDFHAYDDAQRIDPDQALDSFLYKLGVAERPASLADKSALFRSLMASREPMLILLDNVSSAAQIRQLLVRGPHHVIVTSRHLLTGLSSAYQLELDVLPQADAEQLAGDAEVAELCGRLPLALQIMASLRRAHPDTDWATELRAARLGLLHHDDQNVRAAFDLSYRCLSEPQRHLFRLLALHPGGTFTVEGAGALADLPELEARKLLRDLRAANLVEPGYRFHDLVRDYAAERVREEPPEETSDAVYRFVVEFGNRAVKAAESYEVTGDTADLGWLDAHCETLAATVALVNVVGLHPVVPKFALVMKDFLHMRSRTSLWFKVALVSAMARQDRRAEAVARTDRGFALTGLGQFGEAAAVLGQAVQAAIQLGDRRLFARAMAGCAELLVRTGHDREAITHIPGLIAIAKEQEDQETIHLLTNTLNLAEQVGDQRLTDEVAGTLTEPAEGQLE